jgi:hypothetical protein
MYYKNKSALLKKLSRSRVGMDLLTSKDSEFVLITDFTHTLEIIRIADQVEFGFSPDIKEEILDMICENSASAEIEEHISDLIHREEYLLASYTVC